MKRKEKHVPNVLRDCFEENGDAYYKFGTLSSEQKEKLTSYVASSQTRYQAMARSQEIVNDLNNGEKMWFHD